MNKVETIEEFYKRKFDWMPDNIRNEIGHFNVFSLEPFVGDKAQPVPYKRRVFSAYLIIIFFTSIRLNKEKINRIFRAGER
jgi:AraC family transcriptional activator of pobA